PLRLAGNGKAMRSSRWAAALRMMAWVSESLVIGSSPYRGARDAGPSTRSSPPVGGRDRERVVSLGVFAFAERHVGDLAQLGAVVVESADMAPVDLVGVGVEMLRAERRQAFEHGVDLELRGEEGVDGCGSGLGLVAVRHGCFLHPGHHSHALNAEIINRIRGSFCCCF